MISERTVKQMSAELADLKREMALLRSSLISVIGKDDEGDYSPKMVRELLAAAIEEPNNEFVGRGSLLSQLRNLKR